MPFFLSVVLAMFVTFAVADHVARRCRFPVIRYWRAMGIISAILYFTIATYAPLLWDEWLGSHRLIDADELPFWPQVAIGFLLIEFGIYAWHRTMHLVGPIWRLTHQMHHSAERVDIWGAYYFHPLDMVGWALLGSLCLVWIVGLTAEATMVVNIASTLPGMFQHANIRTPHWLGYILQRPESHSIHHERGVHTFNYGDLPLYDILFGTFRNPPDWEGEAGFHARSTKQIAPMLVFRKIA